MRTTFTTKHVLHGDRICDGSCTQGQTDQDHFHNSKSPIETVESSDSLTFGSSVDLDKGVQDEIIHQASRTSKLTMSVSEAADWLGISRAFAYELVARGEIPSIRLGRRVLVPTKRLFAFVLNEE